MFDKEGTNVDKCISNGIVVNVQSEMYHHPFPSIKTREYRWITLEVHSKYMEVVQLDKKAQPALHQCGFGVFERVPQQELHHRHRAIYNHQC